MHLLEAYLGVVEDMSTSLDMRGRGNANVLMRNLFMHDIARVLKVGFHWVGHPAVIHRLVTTTHLFFRLLANYADGKVLTIKTNKLLKRPKKQTRNEEYEEEGIPSEDEGEPVQQGEDEERFQERKYNEKS